MNFSFEMILNDFRILLVLKLLTISGISGQDLDHENHWNVSQWWEQNQDFDHKVSNLVFEGLPQRNADIKSDSDLWSSATSRFDFYSDSQDSDDDRYSGLPKSSTKSIKDTIEQYFSKVRSHLGDRSYYRKVKRNLKQHFVEMGLTTAAQSFWPKEMQKTSSRDKAHNIIAIWPGTRRGTPSDQIIIIGAHYDTVRSSPGVDDNGSGSAAVLEMARLIAENNCKLDKTLIFALFDMEEDGLKGSKHFVKEYLIPIEVNKNRAKIVGAIIMDMILEHDSTRNSQSLGILTNVLPDWSLKVKQNGYRGDFAAVWARKGIDTPLFEKLDKNWLNKDKYRLSLMASPLPEFGSQLDTNRLSKYSTFTRSDHASFWYPPQRYMTFPAVLITDLGPWRRNMKHSYHKSSDDTRNLSEENLLFVKNTIDSVIKTIFDLSKGKCNKSF